MLVLERYPDGPDASDNNLLIKSEKGDANEIFKTYRLTRKTISMARFVKAFKNKAARSNFLAYYLLALDDQMAEGFLEPRSQKICMTTYDRLVKFVGGDTLPFSDLSPMFTKRLEVFMSDSMQLKYNTIMGSMKDLRHVCNLALDEGNVFEYPFTGYSTKMVESERETLEVGELYRLIALLGRNDLSATRMLVLKKFLFSCS